MQQRSISCFVEHIELLHFDILKKHFNNHISQFSPDFSFEPHLRWSRSPNSCEMALSSHYPTQPLLIILILSKHIVCLRASSAPQIHYV